MRDKASEKRATEAAVHIKHYSLCLRGCEGDVGIILGTGWGDALHLEHEINISFKEIPGFFGLRKFEGHKRELVHGHINGRNVFAMRGRVHLNENPDDNAKTRQLVRLQTEMLFHLGVSTLIITNAAGSLGRDVNVGDVVVADGIVTLFAPQMPLYGGEFCSPEDALSPQLQEIALNASSPLRRYAGGYAMVPGPMFEGRRYDKEVLARTGASVVGMSTVPELCIASLYGVKALSLSFVTNSKTETHSHQENIRRAKQSQQHLGALLADIVDAIP